MAIDVKRDSVLAIFLEEAILGFRHRLNAQMLAYLFGKGFTVVHAVVVSYYQLRSGPTHVIQQSVKIGVVTQGDKVFFLAYLPNCTGEFPAAHANTKVVEADAISRVHMVETDVRSVPLVKRKSLKLVLKDKFAEAHFVFFAHATYLVHVFRNDEGHVDVGVVEYLHYFLNLAMVTENVHGSLLKSAFHERYERVVRVLMESASAMGAAVGGFDDKNVAVEDRCFIDAEVTGENDAFAFMVLDQHLSRAEDVVSLVQSDFFVIVLERLLIVERLHVATAEVALSLHGVD